MVRIICLRGIKDSQCGFKMFSRKAVHDIFTKQTINGFGFDVEVLYLARKKGYKIKEIPVTWINDIQTKLNLFIDSFKMFSDVMTVKMNNLKGKYN